jgi:hypothetical protein
MSDGAGRPHSPARHLRGPESPVDLTVVPADQDSIAPIKG